MPENTDSDHYLMTEMRNVVHVSDHLALDYIFLTLNQNNWPDLQNRLSF